MPGNSDVTGHFFWKTSSKTPKNYAMETFLLVEWLSRRYNAQH
jgi:hypothetical protein